MMPDIRSLVAMIVLLLTAGCASQPGNEPSLESSEAKTVTRQDIVAMNNQALTLREQGQFREAASLLSSGIELAPETPELHYNLAVISELYLFELDTALDHYRRYRALTDSEDKLVAGWIADLERRLQ
ncbi:hypothetical protein [Marinobacter sp. DUT-3]|uniref:hypothetical protein n=1 Tax=Marinobacter sp. DUT-3 TaxID=3412036 RepID=UPI003D165E6C